MKVLSRFAHESNERAGKMYREDKVAFLSRDSISLYEVYLSKGFSNTLPFIRDTQLDFSVDDSLWRGQ